MNLKFLYLLLLLSAACCVSCSKDEEPADKGNTSPEEPVYTTFTDAGEVIIPGVLPANFTPGPYGSKGIHYLLPTIMPPTVLFFC